MKSWKTWGRFCGLKKIVQVTQIDTTRKAVAWVYVKNASLSWVWPCQHVVAMISMFTVPTSRGRHNPCHSLSTWPVFFPLPLLFFLGFCRGKTKQVQQCSVHSIASVSSFSPRFTRERLNVGCPHVIDNLVVRLVISNDVLSGCKWNCEIQHSLPQTPED